MNNMSPTSGIDSLIGRKIEGYHILKRVGKGGFGRVYLAQKPSDPEPAAMKIIDIDDDLSLYIEREVDVLKSLDHPHIVRMLHHKRINQQQLIFLEFIQGGSLGDHIRKLPQGLELTIVLNGMLQIADALFYVHSMQPKPIIHRDIKPDNILLRIDERRSIAQFMLTDFGLSRPLETNVSFGVGTLPYMAPEQFGMLGIKPDHRADIYQFGVMLYELCAGRRPFGNENLINELLNVEPTPPSEFVPQIPRQLDDVILKLLAKEPTDRYQSFEEVRFALQAIYQANPASTRQLPTLLLKSVKLREAEILHEKARLLKSLARKNAAGNAAITLFTTLPDGNRSSQVLTQSKTIIGRHIDCDLSFAIRKMSRRHAQIEWRDDGQIFIKDLGSQGGTYLNGQLIPSGGDVLWAATDTVNMAGCEFRYSATTANDVIRTVELGNILHKVKNPKINIRISPDVVHLERGKPQYIQVQVHPENTAIGYYTVQVAPSDEIDPAWYVLPAAKRIEGGQSETFDIIVKLPEHIALQQEKYKMVIGVTADDDENLGVFQVVNISVRQYSDIKASLNSSQILHRKRRAARLSIINDGAIPETISILSGSAGALEVKTSQTEYVVPAKESLDVKLKFKPRREGREARIIPFHVIVRSLSGQNVRIEAMYVMPPPLNISWFYILLTVVMVIVLYRWFGLDIVPSEQLQEFIELVNWLRRSIANSTASPSS